VDLAAYHACETVLAAGGEEPMTVELDADDAALAITVFGVPDISRRALCQRLSAQTAMIGGTAAAVPSGPVRVWLPLTAAPAAPQDDEERQR
jgi:hypothetical protein